MLLEHVFYTVSSMMSYIERVSHDTTPKLALGRPSCGVWRVVYAG